jgi:hypothetical protein
MSQRAFEQGALRTSSCPSQARFRVALLRRKDARFWRIVRPLL